MCLPYEWKGRFLRRENKDADSLPRHPEAANSAVPVLRGWGTYGERRTAHLVPTEPSVCPKETSAGQEPGGETELCD